MAPEPKAPASGPESEQDCAEAMTTPPESTFGEQPHLVAAIAAYVAGDDAAAATICAGLRPAVRHAVRRILSADDGEVDDVVQETDVAVLRYLRLNGKLRGDPIVFAVTVARNRCRNILNWRRRHPAVPVTSLQDWLATPERGPLDLLDAAERRRAVADALARLDDVCRYVLKAFYLEEATIEEIRCRLGLKSVQGVYYRRAVCLERIARFLKERL